MATVLRKVIPWLLATALLTFALRNVSFEAIGRQFLQANYLLIGTTGLVIALGYLAKGKRWQQPLLAMGYRPTVFRATVAIQAGTIAGLAVFGTGEFTRCATLQRTDNVPLAEGIGSVLGERVLDFVMLIPVFLLALLLELSRMQSLLASVRVDVPGLLGWLLGGIVVAALLVLFVVWWALGQPAVRRHPVFATGVKIIEGIWKGYAAIRRLPNPALFIGLTLLLQAMNWLITYLLLLSLDETRSLSPTAALTLVAVSSAGSLVVPTQGGIGTYHFLVSRALQLYGFELSEGTAIATFIHAVNFGINLLLSSLSFLVLPALMQRQPAVVGRTTVNQ